VIRAVGRVVVTVVGYAVRPLVDRLREPPELRCARRTHDPTWDGYWEVCRRCGARREPVNLHRLLGPLRWEWVPLRPDTTGDDVMREADRRLGGTSYR
jgi:hypothetical protein